MQTLIFANENGQGAPFSLDDRIFLGEGLFETLRVTRSKPCYPKLHWQRIQSAALFLGIPFDVSLATWHEKLKHCIEIKELLEGGIKVTLSGGSAPRGLLEKSQKSHLVFDAFQYVINRQPVNLISASWLRDEKNPVYQLKSVNYLEAIIARRQAQATGANEVLFFNLKHHATDTSIANLFIIKNNRLFTPASHCGVLMGIISQRLLALCKKNGISSMECEIDKSRLIQADAIFTCNALQGIRPVLSFEGIYFDINHPLMALLQELLAKDNYD